MIILHLFCWFICNVFHISCINSIIKWKLNAVFINETHQSIEIRFVYWLFRRRIHDSLDILFFTFIQLSLVRSFFDFMFMFIACFVFFPTFNAPINSMNPFFGSLYNFGACIVCCTHARRHSIGITFLSRRYFLLCVICAILMVIFVILFRFSVFFFWVRVFFSRLDCCLCSALTWSFALVSFSFL